MFTRIIALTAAVLVSGFAVAQPPQPPQQPSSEIAPNTTQSQPAPECRDIHTNQVRTTTATDTPATRPDSAVGAAPKVEPGSNTQQRPGTRPLGMANC